MHNIDADLLEAMAEVESGANPLSVSPKGALGLMQLMPATANVFSVLDPFDPVANVMGPPISLIICASDLPTTSICRDCRLCWPPITRDPAQWKSMVACHHTRKRINMCGV